MTATVHPSALVEEGVEIGEGTTVWDNAHIRGPARIGAECIVGEKTYVAYGVEIGDRVKLNAFVYVCTATTIEDGVMVSAGAIFTNDRFPRATTPDLGTRRGSGPGEHTLATLVREGATIGAGAVVGPGLVIGRWAVVGMGSVVTRSVPDLHVVVGSPARAVGCVCRCGSPFLRFAGERAPDTARIACPSCALCYSVSGGAVLELTPPAARLGAAGGPFR